MEKNAKETIRFSGNMQPAQLIFKYLQKVFTEDTIAAKCSELCIARNTSKHIEKHVLFYGNGI